MNVLIFGGSGFLGSHVADELVNQGNKVTLFDIKPSPYITQGQKMIIGDIFDYETVNKASVGMDIVYNFAAVADIDEANTKPLETVKFNILGNAHALEASVKNGVKKFVFASTVYANSNHGAFYRTSKKACEDLVKDYQKIFGLSYSVLRYGSVYGSRGATNSSVYKLLQQALEKREIVYHGTGEEVREYLHVRDAAKLSVEILREEYKNKTLTLTGAQRITYQELLSTINEILGGDIKIKYNKQVSDTHYKMTPFSFNPEISEKILANPQIDLGQGLLDCLNDIHRSLQKKNIG